MVDYTDDIRKGIMSIAKSQAVLDKLLSEKKRVLMISEHVRLFPNDNILEMSETTKESLIKLSEYDVIEFISDNRFSVLYRSTSDDNILFITNKCNSNCTMCPESEYARRRPDDNTYEKILEIIRYMPSDTRYLTITGGEPTLIGENICLLMKCVREHFEGTHFLFLTNGRTFSNHLFSKKFVEYSPESIRIAIPLYGYDSFTHDGITNANGSFIQTIQGIKNLLTEKMDIELRIVVSKLNFNYMDNIADMIINNLSGVSCINIMAIEMMGNAAKNAEDVWIEYNESFKSSKNCIRKLISNGYDVKLYNFPLCKVEEPYWPLCVKSISDYKIRYNMECENCDVKTICGGVFGSTLSFSKMNLEPVRGNIKC